MLTKMHKKPSGQSQGSMLAKGTSSAAVKECMKLKLIFTFNRQRESQLVKFSTFQQKINSKTIKRK